LYAGFPGGLVIPCLEPVLITTLGFSWCSIDCTGRGQGHTKGVCLPQRSMAVDVGSTTHRREMKIFRPWKYSRRIGSLRHLTCTNVC
jgi:hypothetical protein